MSSNEMKVLFLMVHGHSCETIICFYVLKNIELNDKMLLNLIANDAETLS